MPRATRGGRKGRGKEKEYHCDTCDGSRVCPACKGKGYKKSGEFP